VRLAFLLTALLPGFALAQSPTTAIRGRITASGAALAGVEIILRSEATGVTLTAVTDPRGRYSRVGLDPGAWMLTARKPGYTAVRTLPLTLALGRTLDVDLVLMASALRLDSVVVLAQEKTAADRSVRIDEEQIRNTPVSGRSFTDLVALVPWVQLGGSSSQGGSITLPGGRRSGTLLQIDGAGASSTFFGGEPRGSDRVPFPYSIEVVKELEVSASPFEVTTGGFAGGVINAVTRSGTNRWEASLYGYLRDASITGADFSGAAVPDFRSRQFGAWISGPLRRDRMHLFLSIERQARNQPLSILPDPAGDPDPATGIHPDSVARLLAILQDVHGVAERAGILKQVENEWALFGRLDWQLGQRHHLALRYNRTMMLVSQDRILTSELSGHGGDFEARGSSAVLRLTSVLGSHGSNELVLQRATEPRPRTAYSLLPQAVVSVTSDFGDNRQGATVTARCCNDPLLPTQLAESTWELTDNIHVRQGVHDLVLGGTLGRYAYQDDIFGGQRGSFTFSSLTELEHGRASLFTRSLPNPGPDGRYFTADDRQPFADFSMLDAAVYLQDVVELSRELRLTAGLRYGRIRFRGTPERNQALVHALGIRNDVVPNSEVLDARAGVVWDAAGDGSRLFRAGVGSFSGRFPAALYSAVLLADGLSSYALRCTGNAVPAVDYRSYRDDPASIPIQCAGGGQAILPVAEVVLMDSAVGVPRSIKASLGLEQRVGRRTVVGASLLYARTTGNYFPVDRNLRPPQFRSAVEDRPVFAPLTGIRATGGLAGQVIPDSNRITPGFTDVHQFGSPAEARTLQVVVSVAGQLGPRIQGEISYAFTRARDNGSYTCCGGRPAAGETPNDGDPYQVGRPGQARSGFWGPADFERQHALVLWGRGELPWGIRAGGLLRLTSGRPWTAKVDGDPNADGRLNNDRAWIGTQLMFRDPADAALLQQHLDNWGCLRDQVGSIATRNHCRDGWSASLDLRLSRAIPLGRSLSVEVVLDGFNVLNGIDSDWGRQVGVTGAAQSLLSVRGFDPVTGRYIYSVNAGFGLPQDLTATRFDQFSLQLGLRLSYREPRDLQ